MYKGELNGRQVAIKRLLSQFYDLARKELDTLVHSDDHPNVVRCFAMEEDREFVYLALERCSSTLADLAERNPHVLSEPGDSSAGPAPSEKARSIARDVAQGLAALHSRGIVHRDLKPANVLLTACGTAKVSDMGLCKRLMAEQSSFESVGPGGSSGWLAPEQLMQRLPGTRPSHAPCLLSGRPCPRRALPDVHVNPNSRQPLGTVKLFLTPATIPSDAGDCRGRQTKALDVFSLGCVLYYCFTGGKHPFGEERFTRDGNIIRGQRNLEHLKHLPLHLHLVACMLAKVRLLHAPVR